MRTDSFKVVVEPDEGGYHAYCPALRHLGAVTQGATEDEALSNINEVIHMIVNELRDDGLGLPVASTEDAEISEGNLVAITV
jgi:predicted RNase H-like HicB family nuclease